MQNGQVTHDASSDTYYFACPHCSGMCAVRRSDIRCTIFRHAMWLDGRFVPPHASRRECEQWLRNREVFGCARPFRFDGERVSVCDYI